MRLYIAEKPSLGRAIADVLPKPHTKQDGAIKLANGDMVSWCIGHLLEQAEPHQYDERFKPWRREHLPIVPSEWQLQPKPKMQKQLRVLRGLLKQADEIVHAGDPDREGQLLVDELIHYCRVPKTKVARIQRCLINDLNPQAVKKSLEQLRPNREFISLSNSALARSRADWLYGINMTRLCTLQGRQAGFDGVLSIGRVQTPILGLVARRDSEIDAFQSKPFFELEAEVKTDDDFYFHTKWLPSEACSPYMDEDNRVLSRALCENVAERIGGKKGEVSRFTQQEKKQPPPLLFNLSSLQIEAAKRFGLSAKQVLDTCQNLYEKHKLLTYPRSDSRYLPKGHFVDRKKVIAAISSSNSDLAAILPLLNTEQRSRVWNDAKVDAHHAIIPTAKKVVREYLSKIELDLYSLVARQYLMQFLPACRMEHSVVTLLIEGGTFESKHKYMLDPGWKMIELKYKLKGKDSEHTETLGAKPFPALTKGQAIQCVGSRIHDKHTSPPKHFSDATLLAAMTGISRYVHDPSIRQVLKDTDGLGTEATRAGIIELLFKRGFLMRKGKDIRASVLGRQLISALPECISRPDMTAHWESQLESICNKSLKYTEFIEPMLATLDALIQALGLIQFKGLPAQQGFKKKVKPAAAKRRRTNVS